MQKPWIWCATIVVLCPQAWGWGSYGHQQVNRAAIKLLQQDKTGAGIGKCFTTNFNFIQRLAITPDYDWKNLGTHPPTDLLKLRLQADHYEHPHHYFEADAFVKGEVTPEAIRKLPADDFEHAFSTQNADGYPALFVANLVQIKAVNPDKLTETQPIKKITDRENPLPSEVAGADGSAPWRILQLYRLATDALRAKRFDLAFMYMGAMGHYVGDMSQPFHASMNFDGDYYAGPDGKWSFQNGTRGPFSMAAGIHHSFEEAILELAYVKSLSPEDLGQAKAIAKDYCTLSPTVSADPKKLSSCVSSHAHKANPNNDLWMKFAATEDAVMKRTDASALKTPIQENQVVQEVLNLISTGYEYATPLLVSFAEVTKANPPQHAGPQPPPESTSGETTSARTISSAAIQAFLTAKVTKDMTTLDVAEQRIADSATLLARLWISIVNSAGMSPEQIGSCAELAENKIDQASNYSGYKEAFLPLVIKNYPYPTYIFPQLAMRTPQSQKKKIAKKHRPSKRAH